MSTRFHYKKKVFSTTFRIFSDEMQIGSLYEQAFRQSAEGEMEQKKFTFKTRGTLKPETEILDLHTEASLGKIYFTTGMTEATIQLNDRKILWKFENVGQTRWSIFDPNGNQIKYRGSITRGNIDCVEPSELLVLAGLFIASFYWQMTIVIV